MPLAERFERGVGAQSVAIARYNVLEVMEGRLRDPIYRGFA